MATSKKAKQGIERADELVISIGNLILGDENVSGSEWDSVSVVVNFQGDRSLFGYLYDAEGGAEPVVLEESNLVELVEELRTLMAAQGEPWNAVMVQFVDDELRFTFDTDGDSWRLEGDADGEMVEALRPEAAEKPAPKAKKPAAKKATKPAAKAKKTAPKAKKPAAKAKKAAPKAASKAKKAAPKAKKPAAKSRR